eukprot:m.380631 g.380631  ORF g.380631 m.380631 type:complete len:352 (+) comp20959_c0_seq1:220-1275(+)
MSHVSIPGGRAVISRNNVSKIRPALVPLEGNNKAARLLDGSAAVPRTTSKFVIFEDPEPTIDQEASSVAYRDVQDVDARHIHNPQMVAAYAKQIYHHMLKRESRLMVSPDFMERQPEVSASNLALLRDWLVQVHHKFDLHTDTLYITASILTRFLAKREVTRPKLQLLGVTAMLIASKYEDMYPPEVKDFAYMTNHAYTPQQIIQMELDVLKALDFSLDTPVALHFLARYVHVAGCPQVDDITHMIARYLLELCMVHGSMLRFKPSEQAISALDFACMIKNRQSVWTLALEFYSTYTRSGTEECLDAMRNVLRQSKMCKLQAVRKKYSRAEFLNVSTRSDVGAFVINPSST